MSKNQTVHSHSHMWMFGILGVISGLALMIYVPSLKPVSEVLFLFAGFHLVGAIVALTSLDALTGGKVLRRLTRRAEPGVQRLDFGWTPGWMIGPLVAALVSLAAAVALQVALPGWWPLALALTLLSALFFAGHVVAAEFLRSDLAALPMVDFLSSDRDLVLDGGCGAGRTSIAVSRMLKHGKVIALDRFDSDYIEGGGRTLLERNLAAAGVAERVEIKNGDLTRLPFPDMSFDATVSAHAIDHLGPLEQTALAEMHRVLKPGGRFLLAVWVPGWAMFSIASVFSLILTRPSGWRRMAARVGFEIQDEGRFNGVRYFVLRRPSLPAAA